MKQYHQLLQHVLINGTKKPDRTGTGTRSVFGHQMRFNLANGFPLVTTKKIHMKSVIAELLWILSGSTNNNDLRALGSTIWDEWAAEDGSLGPIYGKQWRSWSGKEGPIDQIKQAIEQLKCDPHSRRIVVSAWNPDDLPDMALAPCHALFQFYVSDMTTQERMQWVTTNGRIIIGSSDDEFVNACLDECNTPRRKLSCQLYQRSADVFLGVPFNIASYSLLTHMMAEQCGFAVGDFIWTGGDCHLYENHLEQAALQLGRTPNPLPRLRLSQAVESIFEYTPEDVALVGYDAHPGIKAPVAV